MQKVKRKRFVLLSEYQKKYKKGGGLYGFRLLMDETIDILV